MLRNRNWGEGLGAKMPLEPTRAGDQLYIYISYYFITNSKVAGAILFMVPNLIPLQSQQTGTISF